MGFDPAFYNLKIEIQACLVNKLQVLLFWLILDLLHGSFLKFNKNISIHGINF